MKSHLNPPLQKHLLCPTLLGSTEHFEFNKSLQSTGLLQMGSPGETHSSSTPGRPLRLLHTNHCTTWRTIKIHKALVRWAPSSVDPDDVSRSGTHQSWTYNTAVLAYTRPHCPWWSCGTGCSTSSLSAPVNSTWRLYSSRARRCCCSWCWRGG